jgi:exodeoxyribonuclease V gamma subunit
MADFRLITSNRLETLVELLAAFVSPPLSSPLATEVILVQSRGMERWVSMRLADRLGILASTSFPFPNTFLHHLFRRIFPAVADTSPFSKDMLSWRIMDTLPSLLDEPSFASVREYLGQDRDTGVEPSLKMYQMATRLADLYDQYLVYRPEMIFGWERGEAGSWQALLWRELVKRTGNDHRAVLRARFIEALRGGKVARRSMPERLSVFGISAIPSFHLEVLFELSAYIDVRIFLMNPCRQYWLDISSHGEIARRTVDQARTYSAEELHFERGNRLLASLGGMGSDFFRMVVEAGVPTEEAFVEPERTSLLGCLQSDILNMTDRRSEERIAEMDRSVQIHSCHSAAREIEVLHDQILSMFDEDSQLVPEDILVMAPDIEAYASIIRAVFGRAAFGRAEHGASGEVRLPFNISDRNLWAESSSVRAFLSLLSLEGDRFKATQVLRILEAEVVRGSQGIGEEDLRTIRRWVAGANIRWGMDREDRLYFGLPAYSENTWRAGLSRLILGYAQSRQEMFYGVLPYEEWDSGHTEILEKLALFLEKLFALAGRLRRPHSPKGWAEILECLLQDFFARDGRLNEELLPLERMVRSMAAIEEQSGFRGEVDLEVIRWLLSRGLSDRAAGYGFLTGGITFCSMLPMRSIPFKVICLLGMNDGAFPRTTPHLEFDLMRLDPKPGDRSRRADDRYLFLEALLSARWILYVSYVGQSQRDNSQFPPSVLVSELMDTIEEGFGKDPLETVVTHHRLQGFSPGYFRKGSGLFSYSKECYQTSRDLLTEKPTGWSFLAEELPVPDSRDVNLDGIFRFFRHPVKFLLRDRLYLSLGRQRPDIADREPFHLLALDKYLLEKELVERGLEDEDIASLYEPTRARGLLPHGAAGRRVFDQITAEIERFLHRYRRLKRGKPLDSIAVDLDLLDFHVVGEIELWEEGHFQYRYTSTKPNDRMRVWICHLFLNYLEGRRRSTFVSRDGLHIFKPTEAAGDYLEELLACFQRGLSRPLPFFPESSFAYAELKFEGKTDEEALRAAIARWNGGHQRGEGDDDYYRQCYGEDSPIDREFGEVASTLLLPLISHEERTRWDQFEA